MPDFDIKEIEKLSRRIKVVEKATVVCIILIIIGLFFHLEIQSSLVISILVALYITKIRLNKQLKQKQYMAKMIEERTIELRVQRDQVLMESEKLSAALAALAAAQDELVRNERYATVGQLTKGLVDRILNPLNYINNFAGISKELIGDLEKNLLKEQSSMSKESYSENIEILNMINGNLNKITEHGSNTVRIVKAMEELLKDQKGKMIPTDINNLCKVNIGVISKLFEKEIEEKQINISFQGLTLSLMIDVNIEQMSKVLLHLFKNSLHALMKKASKQEFAPELSIRLEKQSDMIAIIVYDNGIGIEDSIKDRIFEPFFTTKPTAEAAGVGLYTSREVILNHRGTIHVDSEKDEFTEFTIIVPIHQNTDTNE